MAQMTLEEKKTYFALSCRVANVNISDPKVLDLMVELYDKMLEKSGNVDLTEIKKIHDKYLKPETNEKAEKSIPQRG
ncbi:MAG: hypothetical protein P1P88_26380 [Bacteroidales bacterium]|nr:hypothetical protein [Bacteroidales bacterium]